VTDLGERFTAIESGGGRVEPGGGLVRLKRPRSTRTAYVNAELAERTARHPPITMTVRARFSHPTAQIQGTAGFGFWNAAIAPGSCRIGLPRAAWFFAAGPPYDVPIALGVPGRGFKAATLDAHRRAFLALLPTAPLGFLAMRNRWLYRQLWPIAQRAMGVSEHDLSELDLTEMHEYALRWDVDHVEFAIDSRTVLETSAAPGGPLHLVMWIDNAYAIATPRGHFELGMVDVDEPQWIDVEEFAVSDSARQR
jgi:hypothetical protein